MALIFGMAPADFFFSVYGMLGIIATLLIIIVTVMAVYLLKKIVSVGNSINEGVQEVKGKVKKTTKLFDVILDLFSGDDEDEDEEVFVMKKKKK
ncbi:MAG: hypothetical protein PHT91_02440 [Candidatus Nanoarchaeia archaeon]|nr:hypothetical protein [Candidatus Nanoarchaeia archaeon]MDD5054364.1 hypothetical protein [Candidatus Nanoarchaeia archaeon]MDD5499710.1 hypothetical protein [Candidatus Nanoarchaeia archaeon]